jgi:hypothetical protein
LAELADELVVSKRYILKICERQRVNLPFGMQSILHISVVDQIRQAVELDDYIDDTNSLDIYGDEIEDDLKAEYKK